MIFNTGAYYFFFLIPASLAYRWAPVAARPAVCSLFGVAFFLYFSLVAAGGLPGAACLAIFLWEALFSRLYRQGSWLCWLGVAQSLLVLLVFKYWNFLTGLFLPDAAAASFHWDGAFLPLGVSFFTFEFIHYAIDRWRGTTPAGTLAEYLAFILYFPTMVAGPIKRYQDFLPKMREPRLQATEDWRIGVTRILCGLVKKFGVADLMTSLSDHLNSADIAIATRWILPLWLLAFGVKIYFDFSGYSDIAIGSARLFGLKIPENFDWPYLRGNIASFWRHWHMSLSSWLTDYIFIPLGGSRARTPRVVGNLLITMFVSGVWHGAGLNFVLWGLWHGLLLAGHRLWRQYVGESRALASPLMTGLSVVLTFVSVNIGWAFFCMDVPTSMLFFRRLLIG